MSQPHPVNSSSPLAAPARPAGAPQLSPVQRMEIVISSILRIGVLSSIGLIALGMILTLIHHPNYVASAQLLHGLTEEGTPFPHTLAAMFRGLEAFNGRSVEVLGLLLLISTPVVRVAVSIVAFALQRDRLYTLITAIVLALLLISFLLGKAG